MTFRSEIQGVFPAYDSRAARLAAYHFLACEEYAAGVYTGVRQGERVPLTGTERALVNAFAVRQWRAVEMYCEANSIPVLDVRMHHTRFRSSKHALDMFTPPYGQKLPDRLTYEVECFAEWVRLERDYARR